MLKLTFLLDIDGFINQRHKIGGSFSEVSTGDPNAIDDDESNSDLVNPCPDIIPDLIEVTCEENMDTEILNLYFGGKKSGGKRTKDVASVEEINSGTYHIKFESEEGQ